MQTTSLDKLTRSGILNAVMQTPYLSIANWTLYPGSRHRSWGPCSAEEYVEDVLRPEVEKAFQSGRKIVIDLDGTLFYFISFIDEVFGSLVQMHGIEWVKKYVTIKSDERPWLVQEAKDAMLKRVTNSAT